MDRVLPSATAVLGDFLREHPALTPLHGGRVGTALSGVYPAIRIASTGGPRRPISQTAAPNLQIECWADTEAESEDLALIAAATITDIGTDMRRWVRGASEPTEHFPAHDETTGRFRFMFQVTLLLQPEADDVDEA